MSISAVSPKRSEPEQDANHPAHEHVQFDLGRKGRNGRAEWSAEAIRVLIVGTGGMGKALATHLSGSGCPRYEVIGFLGEEHDNGWKVLGSPKDLVPVARQHFIDEVFVAFPCDPDLTRTLQALARQAKICLSAIGRARSGASGAEAAAHPVRYPVIELTREPGRIFATAAKRFLDILLSSALLVGLFPLMLAVAIAIRVDSEGPIFFPSRRLGKKGRVFTCYKFRTMVSDAHALRADLSHLNEREGVLFKIKEDPRVTRLGKFLRKYSLDELPQLWNALAGEMSLVGPRPPLPEEYEQYSPLHRRRLRTKPGITGLWQVTARQDPSFEAYIRLDLQYVENWNLWWDLKILLRTIPAVIRGTGT